MMTAPSSKSAPEDAAQAPQIEAQDEAPGGDDFVPTGAGWEPAEIDIGEDEGRVQRLHLSDPEGDDLDGGDGDQAPEKPRISKAKFRQVFTGSFAAPKMFIGPEWEPFDIQPGEEEGATATADILFDWLAKMGWLPSDDMIGIDAAIALGFVLSKARIAAAILGQAKAKKQAPQAPRQEQDQGKGPTPGGLAWMEPEGGIQ